MQESGNRAKSCTSCRQVKLKCNFASTFPAACSRCSKHGLDCKRDSGFKRTATRHRLEEITSRLSSLQQEIETIRQPRHSSGSPLETFDPSATTQRTSEAQASASVGWVESLKRDMHPGQKWTLGSAEVTGELIAGLFEHFGHHFYPHIPVLEKRPSIPALYNANRFLFWTIILVSCKRHPEHAWLYRQLFPHYRMLLGSILLRPIRSVTTIHAILIICLWPGVVAREAEDPSWRYCGLAINSAMQMSLHHAQNPKDFDGFGLLIVTEGNTVVRALTWMACFQISTKIGCFLGLPPPITLPSQLDALASLYHLEGIPRTFSALAEIQRQKVQFMMTLDESKEPRTQVSLIQFFDRQLDDVRQKFGDAWTEDVEFNLQSAKICLSAFAFLSRNSDHNNDSNQPSRFLSSFRVVMLSGLTAAVRLIHTATKMGEVETDSFGVHGNLGGAYLTHYPKMYYADIFFATVYLIKYLSTDTQAIESDKELVRNHISAAHRIFMQFTGSGSGGKAAQVIELLGRKSSTRGLPYPRSERNHFGASMCYEAFWEAEQLRTEHQNEKGAPSAPEDVARHVQQNYETTTEAPTAAFGQVSGMDSTYLTQIPSLDLDGGWELPWGFWNDSVFEDLPMAEYAEPRPTGSNAYER